MLHYEAVPPRAVEVLKLLMPLPSLSNYYLVGGTSLALRFGHRLSVDLDLFTQYDVDYTGIIKDIKKLKPFTYKELFSGRTGMQLVVDGVKTDFVKYAYSNISPPETIEGIRMLSLEDVACMKLSAISQRGAKKDFYDLHLLLDHYSISELLSLFHKKFPDIVTFHIVKSMNYFEDAENQVGPELKTNLSWEKLKKNIDKKVKDYLDKV
jgi:predicted nucleotidyltransferase component of viral defense system